MSKFYYLVKATNSENVGEIDAKNNDDALKQLNDIFAPDNPITGKTHKGIDITIITETQYKNDKARIAKERKAEATATES